MKTHMPILFLIVLGLVLTGIFSQEAAAAQDLNGIYAEAVAMSSDSVFSGGGEVSAQCPRCGTQAQWKPLNAITAVSHIREDGHYYLSRDLSNKNYYHIYGKVCLHLNGHSIKSSARAIYVETNATLNIMGDGTVSGVGISHSTCDRGGAIDNAGTVNLFGGTYQHTGDYPVIATRGSKGGMNIYDGTYITGTSGYNGSNIRVHTCYLNVYGGLIENGIGTQGGNIYGGKNAKVTIAGGTVTGGTVYMAEAAASLTLTGSPKVDVINLFDGPKADISGLTQGADIAIVSQGAFTEALDNIADYAKYFRSPNEMVKLSIQDNALFGTVDTTADSTAPLSDGKTLKILCLTSSFGLNTTELLYDIAVAEGFEDVAVARLYASGCSLQKHVTSYNNDVGIYWYTKFTKDGKVSIYDSKLLDGLLDENWDIIYIQQGAEQTPQLHTYEDYLDQFMEIIHKHKTNPNAKFIWNMTWAFQGDNTRKIFTDTFKGNQLLMHESIIDAMQEKILTRSDFSAMIPSGAAVQSARTSYFGDRLTKDTLHLNNLGRVIAGYTVLATVTDKDLTEVNVGAVKSYDLTTPIRLSESDRKVVIEAVNAARKDPFAVHQSKYTPEYLNSIGAKAEQLSFSSGDTSAFCPYCEKDVLWKPITGSTENKLPVTDGNWGHYYLAENLDYSSKYLYMTTADGHLGYCLHLNGHNLTSTGKRALWVGAGNTVNIMGTGTVAGIGEGSTDSDYRGAALDVNGHVNLFGGTYAPLAARPAVLPRTSASRVNIFEGATIMGSSDHSAPLVQLNIGGAEFNMFGGLVTGGNAVNGGNIYIPKRASFNMFGGTVSNGYATRFGGNVYASNGTVNLYGGMILGGKTENTSSSYGRGGNVAICGTKDVSPVFNMYGGVIGSETIIGAAAGYASAGGANLYVSYGTANLLGESAVISGGESKSYGGNIMISTAAYVNLNNGTVQNGKSNLGGNVYMAGTSSHFTINGGKLADGSATKSGGNLYANNGFFTMNGGMATGGTAVTAANLYLKVGAADATNMAIIHHDPTVSDTAPVISGGAATGSGGNIYADYNVSLGTFSMRNGKAKTGSNLYAATNCKLTVLEGFDSTASAYFNGTLVDAAGHSGKLSGSGNVTCYDSANADLKTFGTLEISGVALNNPNKTTVSGKDYYTVFENGSYSFHLLEMSITSASLRPGNAGMYFGGTWQCDEALAKHCGSYGIAVSTHNMPGTDFIADPEADNLWTAYTDLQSGQEMQGVMIDGILKDTEADWIKMNPPYGKMPVCAVAYVTIDGHTYVSDGIAMSLYDLLSILDESTPDVHKTALQAFMDHWRSYGLDNWSFDFN